MPTQKKKLIPSSIPTSLNVYVNFATVHTSVDSEDA